MKTDNIVKIYSCVTSEKDPKWDKSCEIAWLMSKAGKINAIALQLENLVNTYGIEDVKRLMDTLTEMKKAG